MRRNGSVSAFTRRGFLQRVGVVAGTAAVGALGAACGGAAPAPTAEKPAEKAAEKPSEKPVVAAAAAPKATGPVSVTFGTGGAPWIFEMWDRVFNTFEDENPGIKVDRKYDPASDWYKVHNKLRSGTAEDVLLMNDDDVFFLSSAGALTILDDYVKRELRRDDYFDRAWEVRNAPGGEIGALHHGGRVRITYYNKKLLDEAGIKPATDWVTDNWTIDQWEQNLQKLTKRSGDRIEQYGGGITGCVGYTWLPNSGIHPWNEDETVSQVNHPEVVALFERLVGWHTKDKIAVPVGEDQLALFNAGKLPLFQGFMHNARTISQDVDWGVMPFMRIKVDPALSFMEDDTYAIPAATKVRDQAWQVNKHSMLEKAQWEFAKADLNVPSLKKVTESPEYLNGNPYGHAGVSRKIWMQSYVHAWRTPTNNPMGEEYAKAMCREDGEMRSGKVGVKDYLDKQQERLTKFSKAASWSKTKNDVPGWRLPGIAPNAGRP